MKVHQNFRSKPQSFRCETEKVDIVHSHNSSDRMISQIGIVGSRRTISRLSARLKFLELHTEIKGHGHDYNSSINETSLYTKKGVILRANNVVKEIQSRFEEFVQNTDFLKITRSNWLRHISRSRNVLQNDVARFQIARSKASEYRCALAALEVEEDPDEDMALELRLRNAALDAYLASLDKMEASQDDFDEEFLGIYKDDLGNMSHSQNPALCSGDILFFIDIHGLQWFFGALDVLNRMTRHFLIICGPGKAFSESYRKLKDQPNQVDQLYQMRDRIERNGQKMADIPLYYEFTIEARTARVAREQLEETATMVLEETATSGNYKNAMSALNAKILQAEESFDSFDFQAPEQNTCRLPHDGSNNHLWSSGLSHPEVCKMMSIEACAPTFISFPEIPVPALIYIEPGENIAGTARLHTRATPRQLLAWGFDTDPSQGIASVSLRQAIEDCEEEEKKARMLQEPKARWPQIRNTVAGLLAMRKEAQQRDTEGVAGELARAEAAGCPADIWDEPPNDLWHPLAAEAARREWTRFKAAALADQEPRKRLRRHGRWCDGWRRHRHTRMADAAGEVKEGHDGKTDSEGCGEA
jgi:hypothetical protein